MYLSSLPTRYHLHNSFTRIQPVNLSFSESQVSQLNQDQNHRKSTYYSAAASQVPKNDKHGII